MPEEEPKNIEGMIDKDGKTVARYLSDVSAKGDFEERLGALRDFHNPSYGISDKVKAHSKYVVDGHPDNPEEFPGAYNSAKDVLDKIAGEYDSLSRDQVAQVMEAYVDQFLEHVYEHDSDAARQLDEARENREDPEALKRIKGEIFSKYASKNILEDEEISGNTGKTKNEVAEYLSDVSKETAEAYSSSLEQTAKNLMGREEEDTSKLAEIMKEEFQEKYDHEQDLTKKGIEQLATEYIAHLKGDKEALAEHGYTPKK